MRLTKLLIVTLAALVTAPATALAQEIPPTTTRAPEVVAGPPAVVALGDSAMSGEAGRWAGNTNKEWSRIDALGSTAYHDIPGGESNPGCHRSKSAEVHIGVGWQSANLACSGARTYTHIKQDGTFKPGIDFLTNGVYKGQALMLREYASTHNVKAVVVLIGANDLGFGELVATCVADWLSSPSWWRNYCQDDPDVQARFTQVNLVKITNAIRDAMLNIKTAMAEAGYHESDYRILAQTYSTPLPPAAGFRYPETGYTRQTVGGCGIWNNDANWARNYVVPTLNTAIKQAAATLSNVQMLDAVATLAVHRVCESTVGLLEEKGLASWLSPGAVDKTEWVSQVRTVSAILPPFQIQEAGHPNYWGQLALRNCLRQAVTASGGPRGGLCVRTGEGLNSYREPNTGLAT